MSIVVYGLFKVVFRKRNSLRLSLRSIFCVSKNVDLVCVFSKNALLLRDFSTTLEMTRNNKGYPQKIFACKKILGEEGKADV